MDDYILGAHRTHRARRVNSRVLFRVCASLTLLGLLLPGLLPAESAAQPALAVQRLAAAPVAFSGPAMGMPTTQIPSATDFVLSCNAHLTTLWEHIGSAVIMTGTAIYGSTGCGVANLIITSPGTGHFHAMVAVPDDDTTGQTATVRVYVVTADGAGRGFVDISTSRAQGPRPIDIDVSHATAIAIDFLGSPVTLIYGPTLSGTARVLRTPATPGSSVPVGAAPVNLAAVTRSCNAYAITNPLSVTEVSIPPSGGESLTACGQLTLATPAQGTLALRFGTEDHSPAGSTGTVSVRVLNSKGLLLRKVFGMTALGTGLRPLWVDLHGASTVIVADTGNATVIITGLGIIPHAVPAYTISNRIIAGNTSSTGVPIDPTAFVSQCNASIGTSDTTVAHAPVFAGTYLVASSGCGTSGLILGPHANGTFHALFGVPDDTSTGPRPTVKVVVQDRTNHPLFVHTYSGQFGQAGIPVDFSVTHASVVSFAFSGTKAILYDMRLIGDVTAFDVVYPASEPLVLTPGGVAIKPSDFTVSCNASVATTDQALVQAASLEQWALVGTACGTATLTLTGTSYPRHLFRARIGIGAGQSPTSNVKVEFNVLNKAGKIVRHTTWSVRYGYGPLLNPGVSLAGGVALQIVWTSASTAPAVVYGMTAS